MGIGAPVVHIVKSPLCRFPIGDRPRKDLHLGREEHLTEQRTDPVLAIDEADVTPLLRRAVARAGLTWAPPQGAGGMRANLTGGAAPQTLVWGTLPGQEGIVGLFEGERLLATLHDGLARVEAVQAISLPGLPHLALMIDDHYDALVGAFLMEQRRRILVWDGRGLRQVFTGLLLSERAEHARWRYSRAPEQWWLHRTVGTLRLHDGDLTQTERVQRLVAPGAASEPVPPAEAFTLLSETESERRYTWNPRLRRFDRAQ